MGSLDSEVGGDKIHGDKVCTISCITNCELLQQCPNSLLYCFSGGHSRKVCM